MDSRAWLEHDPTGKMVAEPALQATAILGRSDRLPTQQSVVLANQPARAAYV